MIVEIMGAWDPPNFNIVLSTERGTLLRIAHNTMMQRFPYGEISYGGKHTHLDATFNFKHEMSQLRVDAMFYRTEIPIWTMDIFVGFGWLPISVENKPKVLYIYLWEETFDKAIAAFKDEAPKIRIEKSDYTQDVWFAHLPPKIHQVEPYGVIAKLPEDLLSKFYANCS